MALTKDQKRARLTSEQMVEQEAELEALDKVLEELQVERRKMKETYVKVEKDLREIHNEMVANKNRTVLLRSSLGLISGTRRAV